MGRSVPVAAMRIFWRRSGASGVPATSPAPFTRAAGARAADFPGIVLDAHGPRVNGYLFLSDRLAAHWPMLDDFEEGYDRVPVEVTTDDGQQISAWIYQLQPRG